MKLETLRDYVAAYIEAICMPDYSCHYFATMGARIYGPAKFWAEYDAQKETNRHAFG